MPIEKVKGGYKFGDQGKVYKSENKAKEQGMAIAYSKYPESKVKREEYIKEHVMQDYSGKDIKQRLQDNKQRLKKWKN